MRASLKRQELKRCFRQRGNTAPNHWTARETNLSIKACRPILVVDQTKIRNLKMSRIFLLQDRKSHLCCTGQVHQSPDSDWSTQKCLTEFKEQQIWTSAVQRRLMAGDHYRDGVGFECPLWSFSDCPLFSGQWPLTPLWVDALVDLALDADTADSVLFSVSCPESVHTTVTCDQDGGRRHFFMAYGRDFWFVVRLTSCDLQTAARCSDNPATLGSTHRTDSNQPWLHERFPM